jgi:hypothetical protein
MITQAICKNRECRLYNIPKNVPVAHLQDWRVCPACEGKRKLYSQRNVSSKGGGKRSGK